MCPALGLRRIELGAAEHAVLVGVGRGEPGIAMLLGTQFEVGTVDVAVLVHVHLVEARGELGIGLRFGAADAAVLVGVQLGHHRAGHAVVARAAVTAVARPLVAAELAVVVLVHGVEMLGQARIGGGLAAVDDTVAVLVERGDAAGIGGRGGIGRRRGNGVGGTGQHGQHGQGEQRVARLHGSLPEDDGNLPGRQASGAVAPSLQTTSRRRHG
ncbi:hypothetical protein NB706_003136 [Xanthomonas sacchari]|nr:hypothetical protein [Xanthomonas sacchari]